MDLMSLIEVQLFPFESLACIRKISLAAILDQRNVFARHGHHCTMPLHTHLGVSATRVSLAAYNSADDIDELMKAIEDALIRNKEAVVF